MIRAKQIVDAPFQSRIYSRFLTDEDGWTLDLLSAATISHNAASDALDVTQTANYGSVIPAVGSTEFTELGIFDRLGNVFFECDVVLDETHVAVGSSSAGGGVAIYGTDGAGDITGLSRYEARIVSESDGGGDADLFLYYGVDGASSIDLSTKLSSVSGKTWKVGIQLVAADTTNFVTFVYLDGEIRARDTEVALSSLGLDVGTRPVLLSSAGDAGRTNRLDNANLVQLPSGGASGGTLVVPTGWDAEIVDDRAGSGYVLLKSTDPSGPTDFEVELGEVFVAPPYLVEDSLTEASGSGTTDITAHTIGPTDTIGWGSWDDGPSSGAPIPDKPKIDNAANAWDLSLTPPASTDPQQAVIGSTTLGKVDGLFEVEITCPTEWPNGELWVFNVSLARADFGSIFSARLLVNADAGGSPSTANLDMFVNDGVNPPSALSSVDVLSEVSPGSVLTLRLEKVVHDYTATLVGGSTYTVTYTDGESAITDPQPVAYPAGVSDYPTPILIDNLKVR